MGRRTTAPVAAETDARKRLVPALVLALLCGSLLFGVVYTADPVAEPAAAQTTEVETGTPPSTPQPPAAEPGPGGSAASGATVPEAIPTEALPAGTTPPGAAEPGAALSDPPAAPPVRLAIAAAGIDVAILPLQPSATELDSQSIVPPFTDDGYWLTSYGQPGSGSTNTTYITGHSWEGREAPFNRLSTAAEVGDTITVQTDTGTLSYVVETITTHNKDTLKNSDIWNITPNQLVIISCYTEDLWGKNVVITASPV